MKATFVNNRVVKCEGLQVPEVFNADYWGWSVIMVDDFKLYKTMNFRCHRCGKDTSKEFNFLTF